MARVLMLAFEGMQPLDFIAPYDLFHSAGVETLVVSENAKTQVDKRLGIAADASLSDAPEADAILVPGGHGIGSCLAHDATLEFLAHCKVQWYTSICTGSLLLAAAGLLRGYRATSHWRYVDLLALAGATPVKGKRIVIDRNRMTGGGVTAGIDFGLHLVAHLCGEDQARLAQLALEYAPVPPYAGSPEEALSETTHAYRERSAVRYAELEHALDEALLRFRG